MTSAALVKNGTELGTTGTEPGTTGKQPDAPLSRVQRVADIVAEARARRIRAAEQVRP